MGSECSRVGCAPRLSGGARIRLTAGDLGTPIAANPAPSGRPLDQRELARRPRAGRDRRAVALVHGGASLVHARRGAPVDALRQRNDPCSPRVCLPATRTFVHQHSAGRGDTRRRVRWSPHLSGGRPWSNAADRRNPASEVSQARFARQGGVACDVLTTARGRAGGGGRRLALARSRASLRSRDG